jgi:hypothetical protein
VCLLPAAVYRREQYSEQQAALASCEQRLDRTSAALAAAQPALGRSGDAPKISTRNRLAETIESVHMETVFGVMVRRHAFANVNKHALTFQCTHELDCQKPTLLSVHN